MNRLNVVGMIVSPRSPHSTRVDVIRNDVAVIRELPLAEGAHTVLGSDLTVHQLPHFGVRTNFSVSAGVLRIINVADAHPVSSLLLGDGFPSAACKRTVNWA